MNAYFKAWPGRSVFLGIWAFLSVQMPGLGW